MNSSEIISIASGPHWLTWDHHWPGARCCLGEHGEPFSSFQVSRFDRLLYFHRSRLNPQSSCGNCWYFGRPESRSVSLGRSKSPSSQEYSRTEWRRTSGTPVRLRRKMSSFITSELAGETDNVVNGVDIRTSRVFRLSLFERIVILFPGQVWQLTRGTLRLERIKPCDLKTRETRTNQERSNNRFEFIENNIW